MNKKLFILFSVLIVVAALALGGAFLMRKEKKAAYTNTVETPALEEENKSAEEGTEEEMSPASEEVLPKEEAKETGEKKEETKKTEAAEEAPAKKESGSPSITNRLMSSGFAKSSGRKIDTIVLHSSYDALGSEPYSVSGLIKEYEEYGVSAHYLIDRKGNIYRLVEDKNIAYHAGSSKMKDGRTNVNDFSIGIEMMNLDDGKSEYTSAQYAAINALVDYLKGKYAITSVVGHDDIAPGRKSDPWNFDWKKLK